MRFISFLNRMNKMKFKLLYVFISVLAFSSCQNRQNQKPNILVILVDDMGYNGISCFGNKPWKTPNIDRLASEGMKFTNAYASPVCSPTRASILTGKNAARVDITNWIPGGVELYANPKLIEKPFTQFLPLSEYTVAEAFKENDYATAHIGKWHLGEGPLYLPDKHGFDYSYLVTWSNLPTYFVGKENNQLIGLYKNDAVDLQFLTDHLADKAMNWLDDHRDSPFFMLFATQVVHKPIAAKDEVKQKYIDKGLPDKGRDAADYAAMHEQMDIAVGRLLDYLDDNNLTENTIVLFLSDNGGREPETVNTPFRGGKGEILEGGIRVPLLVRWPKNIAANSKSEVPVITHDFYPTLLDLAGYSLIPQQHMDGVSFAPVFTGIQKTLDERALYWHYPHYTSMKFGQPSSAIRKGDWKLIEFLEDNRLELYDLKKDPSESNNLLGEKPNIADELRQLLDVWRKNVDAKMPVRNPDYDSTKYSGWPKSRK